MRKVLVTIVGRDRPGIVHLVSDVLSAQNCHIRELTQTTLWGQFAGLFSANTPDDLAVDILETQLIQSFSGTGLAHWITPLTNEELKVSGDSEPYVITLTGPDSQALIPGVTKTVASFDANIDNLRAVSLDLPTGDSGPPPVVLVLEISVPKNVQQSAFRQALSLAAEELKIEISLQHRDIFEATHRL